MTLPLILWLFFSGDTAPANVDIWCDTQLGEVTPLLFGSGDEMDEEFLPFDDLSALVGQTGVTMLRMGGIQNEYYDWEGNDYNGTRYIDLVDTLIIIQNVETSMDHFLQLCEINQIEPVLSVNFQLNDPGKAARFVEYCNGDQTTPMGQIRAQRGHPAPYNVTYWEIGNEPDISGVELPIAGYSWTLFRHFGIPFAQWHWSDSTFVTSTQYAQLANVYADTMRASSPIPLEIATISLAGDITWLEETISTCGSNTDWVDLHYYPAGTWDPAPPDTSDYIEWLMSIDTGPNAFEPWYSAMRDSVTSFNGGVPIPTCIMEYNAIVVNPDPVWWNYIDCLFVADCAGHLARMGCPVACSYSIFEGEEGDPNAPFGMIRGDTLSMRATAWVMKLYSQYLGGTMVEATSDAAGGGYGLEVHASLRDDGLLCLMAVNKHLTQQYETQITLHGFTSSGYAQLIDITNDAPIGAPTNGTTGIQYKGGIWGTPTSFSYTFPKASVTCLLIHPEGSGTGEVHGDLVQVGFSPLPVADLLRMELDLPVQSRVQIMLFDCAGRLRASILDEELSGGTSCRQWNRGDTPSGVYLVRVTSDDTVVTVRKITII